MDLNKTLTFKPEINDYMPIHKENRSMEIIPEKDQYTYKPAINMLSALFTQDRQYETD